MNMLTLPLYLTHLCIDENIPSIFKQHPNIPLMVDVLSRYERRHLLTTQTSSEKINLALIQSMLAYLSETHYALRHAHLFIWDYRQFTFDNTEFAHFKTDAKNTHKPIIIVLNNLEPLLHHPEISTLLSDPQFRFIVFDDFSKYQHRELTKIETFFSVIPFTEPSELDLFALLKLHKTDLEQFHQVTISDEAIATALTLTRHYLCCSSIFDKALELLDSAAARTCAYEKMAPSPPIKAIVSTPILTEIVSNLTQIPTKNIQNNMFQASQFINAIEQHIFGQHKAITLMSSLLQQAYIKLNNKKGPLCSFLLVGQSDIGKTALSYTLANYLFGHEDAILPLTLDKNLTSLADIKINTRLTSVNLLEGVKRTPYAVILIDDIQAEHAHALELFKEVFTRGFVMNQGEKYDFSNTIILMTTQMGSEAMAQLLHHPQQEQNPTTDLMQLVLNENVLDIPSQIHHALTPAQLCEMLLPTLNRQLPAIVLQNSHVVPFVPLDFVALEKVMRLIMKSLVKSLNERFSIELNYVSDVIKFLAHEAYWRKPNKSLEKLLEQLLYSTIAHEVMARNHDKNRPKKLLLQLNQLGQSLKCEYVTDRMMVEKY